MAITIRKIDDCRESLDWYKDVSEIATDSAALVSAVQELQRRVSVIHEMEIEIEAMRSRAEKAERILAGLEEYLVPALENIRQQEMDI